MASAWASTLSTALCLQTQAGHGVARHDYATKTPSVVSTTHHNRSRVQTPHAPLTPSAMHDGANDTAHGWFVRGQQPAHNTASAT